MLISLALLIIIYVYLCPGSAVQFHIYVTLSPMNPSSLVLMDQWEEEWVPLSLCQSRGKRSWKAH